MGCCPVIDDLQSTQRRGVVQPKTSCFPAKDESLCSQRRAVVQPKMTCCTAEVLGDVLLSKQRQGVVQRRLVLPNQKLVVVKSMTGCYPAENELLFSQRRGVVQPKTNCCPAKDELFSSQRRAAIQPKTSCCPHKDKLLSMIIGFSIGFIVYLLY